MGVKLQQRGLQSRFCPSFRCCHSYLLLWCPWDTLFTCMTNNKLYHRHDVATQADREAYEVGPELLAAGKLPLAPSGMAFGGEYGPDPATYDIMNTDDFGIWQNKTMGSSSGNQILVEASIPGCAVHFLLHADIACTRGPA